MPEKGISTRWRLALLGAGVAALMAPAAASANITALDPSVQPGSSTTVAQAIVANQSNLTSATSDEYAFGGAGAPSPMGVGCVTDTNADPEDYCATGVPQTLVGFPTDGATYGILSSGQINDIGSVFDQDEPCALIGQAGESCRTFNFTSQFPAVPTNDRGDAEDYTVLTMVLDVPGGANCLALDYRFLTEEFPEYVGSEYNDAFIGELDGTSWTVDSGGNVTRPLDFAASPAGTAVSVNGAGPTAMFKSEAAGTYFDGATGLVTTKTPITSGAHTVRLSIFDAGDSDYDSAVFLDRLRLITESATTCQPPLGLAPPAGAAPVPVSNEFSLGGGSSIKLKNGAGTITFNLPGAGTVALSDGSAAGASAASVRAAKKKKGKKRALVAPTSATASAAGPLAVPFRLTKAGKKALKAKKKLRVSVAATFTPNGGSAKTQVFSLKVKSGK